MAAWLKVAICEEGGTLLFRDLGPWFDSGAAYPDSLGISAANWYANGGGSDVSANAQIAVAERIQASPPDQDGCTGSW
jgi:hypothetical protein